MSFFPLSLSFYTSSIQGYWFPLTSPSHRILSYHIPEIADCLAIFVPFDRDIRCVSLRCVSRCIFITYSLAVLFRDWYLLFFSLSGYPRYSQYIRSVLNGKGWGQEYLLCNYSYLHLWGLTSGQAEITPLMILAMCRTIRRRVRYRIQFLPHSILGSLPSRFTCFHYIYDLIALPDYFAVLTSLFSRGVDSI